MTSMLISMNMAIVGGFITMAGIFLIMYWGNFYERIRRTVETSIFFFILIIWFIFLVIFIKEELIKLDILISFMMIFSIIFYYPFFKSKNFSDRLIKGKSWIRNHLWRELNPKAKVLRKIKGENGEEILIAYEPKEEIEEGRFTSHNPVYYYVPHPSPDPDDPNGPCYAVGHIGNKTDKQIIKEAKELSSAGDIRFFYLNGKPYEDPY